MHRFARVARVALLLCVRTKAGWKIVTYPAQIDASPGSVFGVDTQLIIDGTHYVIDGPAGIVAAGGEAVVAHATPEQPAFAASS